MRTIIGSIGASTSASISGAESQLALTSAADIARSNAHGVNIDEEMVNLIIYQRSYESAARVMTAIDQNLDTLINRTGIVGR
ncbi:flagellar hook-associated protein FlgK [bacterium BMS3Bbin02]|nr:flagellar hook-associated protein FlgK [bacterium BMS3Bbin02]